MADLTEVGVHLQVQGSLESTADINRVGDAASRTAAQLRLLGAVDVQVAIQQTTTGLQGAARQTDSLSNSLTGLDRQLRSVSSSFGGFVGDVAKYGTLAFAGVTAAVGGFGLAAASSFENSRIAFGALLGDVQKGNQLFSQLQAFNLKTPFGLGDLTQGAQQLLAYQVPQDKLLPLLQSLTNVASTAPGNLRADYLQRDITNIGQIYNSGRVRGQDINQLALAGFPIYGLLGEATGMSQQDLQKQIHGGGGLDLSGQSLIDLLASGQGPTLQRYQGAAQSASQSLSGQFSNFKDTLQTNLAGAASPLAGQLKTDTLPALTTGLDTFLKVAGPPLFTVLGDMTKALTALLPIIQPVLAATATGFDQLFRAAAPLKSALQPIGAQLGVAVQGFFAELAKQMPVLAPALVDLARVMPAFVGALTELIPLVTPLLKLFDGLLGLDGATDVVGKLLVGLLAYNALSGTIRTVSLMAGALRGLTAAQIAANATGAAGGAAGAAGAAGRNANAARYAIGAAGIVPVGISTVDAAQHGVNVSDVVTGALSGLTAGAALGTPLFGVGAVPGAIGGALIGAAAPVIGGIIHNHTHHSTTVLQQGAVVVQNPQTDADIAKAVQDGIVQAQQDAARRATQPVAAGG